MPRRSVPDAYPLRRRPRSSEADAGLAPRRPGGNSSRPARRSAARAAAGPADLLEPETLPGSLTWPAQSGQQAGSGMSITSSISPGDRRWLRRPCRRPTRRPARLGVGVGRPSRTGPLDASRTVRRFERLRQPFNLGPQAIALAFQSLAFARQVRTLTSSRALSSRSRSDS